MNTTTPPPTATGTKLGPVALLSLGMVMSGSVGYFVVESGLPPAVAVFWRCALGAAALLVLTAARRGTRRCFMHLLRSRAGMLVALSGVLLVSNWILLFSAYEYLSIGIATVVFHVEPFVLIGLGALVLGDRITGMTLASAGLGFVGIVLVAEPWAAEAGRLHEIFIGVGLALAAALLYAASIITVRRIQAIGDDAPSPLIITTGQLITGAVVTLPVLMFVPYETTTSGWAHIVVLGLVNTALMYLIIYAAYPRLGTATIGVLSFLYPAAAVVIDYFAYDVVITLVQFLGFAAVAGAGVGQVLTSRGKRGVQR